MKLFKSLKNLNRFTTCPVCQGPLNTTYQGVDYFSKINEKTAQHIRYVPMTQTSHVGLSININIDTNDFTKKLNFDKFTGEKNKRPVWSMIKTFFNETIFFHFKCDNNHYDIIFRAKLSIKTKKLLHITIFSEYIEIRNKKSLLTITNSFNENEKNSYSAYYIYKKGKETKYIHDFPCLLFNGKNAEKIVRNINLLM